MNWGENSIQGYRMIFEDRNVCLYRTFRHEMGNPLSVISGYLEMMEYEETVDNPLMKDIEENDEEVRDFVEETEKIVNLLDEENWVPPVKAEEIYDYRDMFDGKLGKKVDDVVEMISCLKDYQEVQGLSYVDCSISAKELVSMLEEDYGARIESELPDQVEVRANKAAKIVSRTVGENWVKYGSETGNSLQCDEAELRVELYQDQGDIVFGIGDNGPGLEDKDCEEIFEKDKGSGTGFGLYLGKEILDCFDGDIEYCQDTALNEEGFGCKFRLEKV